MYYIILLMEFFACNLKEKKEENFVVDGFD
jgi:hypothetical protein